jgi:hypothetical protein
MSLLLALSIFGIGHAVSFPPSEMAGGAMIAYLPYPPGPIAGLILTDSVSMVGPLPVGPEQVNEVYNVLPQVLLRLYQETGGCFAGFCIPGASIAPTYHDNFGQSMLYVEALSIALEYLSISRVDCILCVSSGNDFYRRSMYGTEVDMGVFRSFFRWYARDLLYALTDATDSIGMVVGGSAAAWDYDHPMYEPWLDPLRYDDMARMAYWCFCLACIATRGEDEFRRLNLRVRIGQVENTSGSDLVGMLLHWVLYIYDRRRRSML